VSGEIRIDPLTRVEGHGNVIIRLKEGKIREVELNVVESPRFFERMLQGKPAEEAPRLSERICGICYVDHHLASIKAVEAAWGVEPPETAVMLRRLLHNGGFVTSHVLHGAFLCLPDLLEIKDRNILGVAKENPEAVNLALRLHEFGNRLVHEVGGKVIHTVTAIPGGMAKPLTVENRDKLLKETDAALKDVKEFADLMIKLVEKKAEEFKGSGNQKYYMALTSNGRHELYDGLLRVIDPAGKRLYEFKSSDYLEFIAERVAEHSFVKRPYLKSMGYPKGTYRVGPLARLNVAEKINGEEASRYASMFYKFFGKPSHNPMAYNMARMVEAVSAIEEIKHLLSEEKITSENVRVEAKEKKGVGVGIVEAPRGVLIHHYETDDAGLITSANVIPPTTQNSPTIEIDIRDLAEQQLKKLVGAAPREALWKIETLVRAYDPCISCATHMVEIVKED